MIPCLPFKKKMDENEELLLLFDSVVKGKIFIGEAREQADEEEQDKEEAQEVEARE